MKGIGKLTVVGPSGIKSYLDVMTPFMNRKYPVLDINEVDSLTTKESLLLKLDYLTVNIIPVFANQV
jgi:hypothetical protein